MQNTETLLIFILILSIALALIVIIATIIAIRQSRTKIIDDAIMKTRDELQAVSADKVIEALTGDSKIFDQIQQYILRQNFIIRKFNLHLELKWLDEEKDKNQEFIQRTMSISHQIENISGEKQIYKKIIIETLENEDVYPDTTEIVHVQSYRVRDKASSAQDNRPYNDFKSLSEAKTSRPSGDNNQIDIKSNGKTYTIGDRIRKQNNLLRLELEDVPLEPKEAMGFVQTVKSINRSRDFHTQTIARIADGFEVTIVHPEDLNVNASPLHPAQNSFEEFTINRNSKIRKTWICHAGILPHQGVLITWSKKM